MIFKRMLQESGAILFTNLNSFISTARIQDEDRRIKAADGLQQPGQVKLLVVSEDYKRELIVQGSLALIIIDFQK